MYRYGQGRLQHGNSSVFPYLRADAKPRCSSRARSSVLTNGAGSFHRHLSNKQRVPAKKLGTKKAVSPLLWLQVHGAKSPPISGGHGTKRSTQPFYSPQLTRSGISTSTGMDGAVLAKIHKPQVNTTALQGADASSPKNMETLACGIWGNISKHPRIISGADRKQLSMKL